MKLKRKLLCAAADISYDVSEIAYGLASTIGLYQPKEPKSLKFEARKHSKN